MLKPLLSFCMAVVLAGAARAQDWDLPTPPATAGEPGVATRGAGGNPQVENCRVDLVDVVDLPATEAGVLVHQGLKAGASVKTEEVVAKIDSRIQEMDKKVAVYEYNAAVKRANDDIEIVYAKAAAEAAQAALDEVLEVLERVPKAISGPERRKTQLEAKRSKLGVKKAENDRQLSLLDAYSARAKVDAADAAIDIRTIRAPFDGLVQDVYREQAEWVNPGDPIVQLVRMDTLKVEGWVYIADYSPAELDGCEVTIKALGAKGKEESASGRVVFVSNILTRGDRSQKMLVRAEITNRTRNGRWVILPNMRAEMTIHLGTGGASVSSR